MKDNIKDLLDVIDNPEVFSEDELRVLLCRPDTKALYHVLAQSVAAMHDTGTIEIAEEWKRFASRHRQKRNYKYFVWGFIRQHAAAVIILFVAFTLPAAIFFVKNSLTGDAPEPIENNVSAPEVSNKTAEPSDIICDEQHAVTTGQSNIETFKNVSIEEIIRALSEYYNLDYRFASDDAKYFRLYFQWDKSLTAEDVVEQLNNFERITISLRLDSLVIE